MAKKVSGYFFFFFFFLSDFFDFFFSLRFLSAFFAFAFFSGLGFFEAFFLTFFGFDWLFAIAFAVAIVAFERTGPKPGTELRASTVVEAMSSALLYPFSARTAAIAGPTPVMSVMAVLIGN